MNQPIILWQYHGIQHRSQLRTSATPWPSAARAACSMVEEETTTCMPEAVKSSWKRLVTIYPLSDIDIDIWMDGRMDGWMGNRPYVPLCVGLKPDRFGGQLLWIIPKWLVGWYRYGQYAPLAGFPKYWRSPNGHVWKWGIHQNCHVDVENDD